MPIETKDTTVRAVYKCEQCAEKRVYGTSCDPQRALIHCANCGRLTWHAYDGQIKGWIGAPCPLAPRF